MSIFEKFECGESIPRNNVHAVSVSIPTIKDVIDYEIKTPEIQQIIKSGYPRFVLHPYLKKITRFLRGKYSIPEMYEIILVSSIKAQIYIEESFSIKRNFSFSENFGILTIDKTDLKLNEVLSFIQHTGYNLSSRFAEKYLYDNASIKVKHLEETESEENALTIIKTKLAEAYQQPNNNIYLTPSGMNAVYSVLMGLLNQNNNRKIIVQLGWLYLDTMNIIKKYSTEHKVFFDLSNLDEFENYINMNSDSIAAIITEIPTNPLVQTVDLDKIKQLTNKFNIPLVIDSTIGTAYNLNLKNYADIFIESLTKFACGNADVLMGCFIFNENSSSKFDISIFNKYSDEPYKGDLQRLAFEIKHYKERVEKISLNTLKLVEYFQQHKSIKDVFWSGQNKYFDNYKKLIINDNSHSGLISITFNKPFDEVYNNLNFPKGPSLGTEFTLLMPYVYLAHYDLITSESGRELLEANNIPIDLLRISVGNENIDDIIAEFERVFQID